CQATGEVPVIGSDGKPVVDVHGDVVKQAPLAAPTGLRQMALNPEGNRLFVAAPNYNSEPNGGPFSHQSGNLVQVDLAFDSLGVPFAKEVKAIPVGPGTYGRARAPIAGRENDVAITSFESDNLGVFVTNSANAEKR